jgi:hypothetical protein
MDAARIQEEMLGNKLQLADQMLERDRIDGQLAGLKAQREVAEAKIAAHRGAGERLGVLLKEAETEEKEAAQAAAGKKG